jgi:hypothetical protein
MIRRRSMPLLAAGWLMLASQPGETREPWQLGHGPFTTAADVRDHNQLGQDLADLRAALAQTPPDFAEALNVFAFGRHFPWQGRTHALGQFADDYNGKLGSYLAEASELYGGPTFLRDHAVSALAGTGPFRAASVEARAAAAETIAEGIVLAWCRFELLTARDKALAATPNWSLQNGAPKNWNEIFAFWYGPDGRHSLFEALAKGDPERGPALSAALLESLAAGQEDLVAERWPEVAAARVEALLDLAGIVLLESALAPRAELDEPAWPIAAAAARGRLLGAAQALGALDRDLVLALDEALATGDLAAAQLLGEDLAPAREALAARAELAL